MTGASFPADWVERTDRPATDLELAVLLVNSHDALADPPDRLQDLIWLTAVLSQVGHGELAAELAPGDLASLRTLRSELRAAFEAADVGRAAALLNPLLTAARAVPLLVVGPSPQAGGSDAGAWLDVGAGRRGLESLQARLPTALAQHIASHGVGRLGTCASDPCQCAFVDRTRAGTRRYCCSYCNDRAAARAYRRRQRAGQPGVILDKSDSAS